MNQRFFFLFFKLLNLLLCNFLNVNKVLGGNVYFLCLFMLSIQIILYLNSTIVENYCLKIQDSMSPVLIILKSENKKDFKQNNNF